MAEMRFANVQCSDRKSAEAMSTLLQNCDPGQLNIGELSLDNIGVDGWEVLAKALSTVPGCVLHIISERKDMKEGGCQNHLGVHQRGLEHRKRHRH